MRITGYMLFLSLHSAAINRRRRTINHGHSLLTTRRKSWPLYKKYRRRFVSRKKSFVRESRIGATTVFFSVNFLPAKTIISVLLAEDKIYFRNVTLQTLLD